jgi:hypothetical protein
MSIRKFLRTSTSRLKYLPVNPNPEEVSPPDGAGFLYRVSLAFPSWAGAMLAVYSVFLWSLGALRLRLK